MIDERVPSSEPQIPESTERAADSNSEEVSSDFVLDRDRWHKEGEKAFQKAVIDGKPLSVIFLDLNFFKSINDTFGHEVGDKVIADFRGLVNKVVLSFRTQNTPDKGERDLDLVAFSEARTPLINGEPVPGHVGGDEFTILASADAAGIKIIVERLQALFKTYINRPEHKDLKDLEIGMAIGTATLVGDQPQEGIAEFADLVRIADKAMLQNKLDQLPELDEHQKKGIRLAASVLRAYGIRFRDVPKLMRLRPELFGDDL